MALTKAAKKSTVGFSDAEKAAARERIRELKAEAAKADGENECVAKIKAMPKHDREMAERIHAIVKATVPDIEPKTWYGMPAYAKDGKSICFFKPADKFKARYATLGFTDNAHLDEGTMWASEFAITELTAADEKRLSALLKKAVS